MGKWELIGKEAETMYVVRGLTLTEISKLLKVSIQTLSAWKNRYKWDEKRMEMERRPERIVSDLEQVLAMKARELKQKIEEGEEVSDKQFRSVIRMFEAIQSAKKKTAIIDAAPAVMKEFALFLRQNENFGDLGEAFGEILPEFMEYLWEKYRG